MSGGRWQYSQHHINDIADSIESIIHANKKDLSECDDKEYKYNFNPKTITKFKKAVKKLKEAYVYAQRVDWGLS